MKYVYGILLLLIFLELGSIRMFLGVIAAAYQIWAESLEKEANPLLVVDAAQGPPVSEEEAKNIQK